jgi:hypothetical protein
MKKTIAILSLIFLNSCATSAQLKELKELKCEKLVQELELIRSYSAESTISSIVMLLKSKDISDQVISEVIAQEFFSADSVEPPQYLAQIRNLAIHILKTQDCLSEIIPNKPEIEQQSDHDRSGSQETNSFQSIEYK